MGGAWRGFVGLGVEVGWMSGVREMRVRGSGSREGLKSVMQDLGLMLGWTGEVMYVRFSNFGLSLFEDGEIGLTRDAATAHQIQDAGHRGHAI